MYHRFAAVENKHWWFQGRRRVVAEMLRGYLADHPGSATRGLRVLDVGSGTGEMVDMLREFGTVTAVDDSSQAVEYCRQRHPVGVAVRCGRVPEALDRDEVFDLVTAFDVLEHIDDDVTALRAFRDVLAPDGRMALTVPAYPALWSHHDVYAGHVRRYRRHQLREVIRQTGGFQVDRSTYFNSLLFLPALAVRMADRWRRQISPRPFERSDPHLELPWAPVNRALLRIFAAEARMLRHVEPPFGVSLIMLCRAV